MDFSVPWNLSCEAESQQEPPWSSLAVVSPVWSQKGQLSPRSHNSDSLCITPEGVGRSTGTQNQYCEIANHHYSHSLHAVQ